MPSTNFSDMPTLGSSIPPASPPLHVRRKSWARRAERCCYNTFAYFPLLFVYGLTTWAIYVEVGISLDGTWVWLRHVKAGLGIALYALANISYSIAVFTSPGSPLDPKRDGSRRKKDKGYEGLPTHEDENTGDPAVPHEWMSLVTAKSTGKPRYCKKCMTVKPDRTHHCASCGRCVLKMDHHCPWLATCVGLRNYKPFLLFLVYVSLFSWLAFGVAAFRVWNEVMGPTHMEEGLRVVNIILLAVLGGIIGLVISGFTGWHLYLTLTGQTTIESLEKTRYLSPLRNFMKAENQSGRNYIGHESTGTTEGSTLQEDQPLVERLKEIHANALPGVLRPEEGEVSFRSSPSGTPGPQNSIPASGSPARASLQRSYAAMEAQRERDRYNMYLDEMDSQKMPNAFDLGWKRNFIHVFGDEPFYWWLPMCNTSGDGWSWEVSPKWAEARDRVAREREARLRADAAIQRQLSFEAPPRQSNWRQGPSPGYVDHAGNTSRGYVNEWSSPSRPINGTTSVQMQPLDRQTGFSDDATDQYDTSSDENGRPSSTGPRQEDTANWNDIPDEFIAARNGPSNRSHSRGRRKGD